MISLDELKYTQNRLELLINNSENPEEIMMANIIVGNLDALRKQLEAYSNTDEFKEQAKRYSKE